MYFNNAKDIAKNARHQVLIEKMSPILQSEVQDRNGSWIKKLGIFNGQKLSREFVVGMCNLLHGTVYEPSEKIAWDDQLFCVSRGVASQKGKIRTAGTFWGEDFILECEAMKEKYMGHAMTFVEILVITRTDFFLLLDDGFTNEATMVRKSVVKMAVNRGVMAAAKLIRDKRALEETGSYPLKSIGIKDLTESLSAQKMDDEIHHCHVKPGEQMRRLIHEQSRKMIKFEAKLEMIAEQQDKLLQCMSRLMAQYDDVSSIES